MSAPHFVVYQGAMRRWRWCFVNADRQVRAVSGVAFDSVSDAKNDIGRIKSDICGQSDVRIEVSEQ